jgi:Zn-dependent M28 family amino/carboxypeptidase
MWEEVNKGLAGVVILLALATGLVYHTRTSEVVAENSRQEEVIVRPPVGDPPKPTEPEFDYEDAVESITEKELKETVYHLADYDVYKGRVTGQPGNVKAAAWLKEKFESYGLPTMYDEFSTRRGKTKNIYAWIEGSQHRSDVIVVGAHFDHVSNSPGADDNASGTALVLELAEAFSKLPKDKIHRTIAFHLYSGEEQYLLGSKHYCQHPKFPLSGPDSMTPEMAMNHHVFMLNADMVGRLNEQQYTMLYDEEVDDVGQIVQDLSSKYPFALSITKRGSGGSDQTPFLNKGVSTAWLFTGQHGDYHRPTDTADRIDYDGLLRISRYAFELTYAVDKNKRHLCLDGTHYMLNQKPPIIHDPKFDHDDPTAPFPEAPKN